MRELESLLTSHGKITHPVSSSSSRGSRSKGRACRAMETAMVIIMVMERALEISSQAVAAAAHPTQILTNNISNFSGSSNNVIIATTPEAKVAMRQQPSNS